MQIFTVGGAVRDMLMGIEPKDIDYVVVGSSPEEMLELGFTQVGAGFPVFLDKEGNEYALARTERKTGVGYTGFTCSTDKSVTLEEDLMRRDLTINAMAIDENGDIVDPFNGLQDIKDGILRHVSTSFAEDSIRVLRAARFAARYGFTVVPETLELMRSVVPELDATFRDPEGFITDAIPKERVWLEIQKGLSEKYSHKMFEVLESVGAFNTEALKPFSEYEIEHLKLIDNSVLTDNIRAKFVCISQGFTDSFFDINRIPSDMIRIAKIVKQNSEVISNYGFCSTKTRLQLLMETRAINDPDFIREIFAINDTIFPDDPMSMFLEQDLTAISKVDAREISKQYKKGEEIKQALMEARMKEMELVIE